ncbi:MAG: putative phosphatase [Tenericutes bacterium ADurb.BinA155]|nr:MAG: putative phosphatase [Tenericutes bacterium ADurb.BinA155]
MAIQIAFFDIDWTLYDHSSHTWVLSGLQAIKQLQKNGVKIYLCSARPYNSMKLFGVFDLGIRWDGYIASAGAVAYGDHHFIKTLVMPKPMVHNLIQVTKELGLPMEMVGIKTRFMTLPPNDYVEKYHWVYKDTTMPVRSYRGEPLTGALLFAPAEYDEELKRRCPGVRFDRFADYGVDVMDVPHEKGDAIKDVLAYYGYSKDEAIAFGDDYQDLTMVPQVGIFVCVGNGKDEVKKAATYVARPISEDGILESLQHYHLV